MTYVTRPVTVQSRTWLHADVGILVPEGGLLDLSVTGTPGFRRLLALKSPRRPTYSQYWRGRGAEANGDGTLVLCTRWVALSLIPTKPQLLSEGDVSSRCHSAGPHGEPSLGRNVDGKPQAAEGVQTPYALESDVP